MSWMKPSVCAAAFLSFLLAAASSRLDAGECGHGVCFLSDCHTPAYGAPAPLWDELQALDSGRIPLVRDSTAFNEQIGDWNVNTYFMSLDVEEEWVFVAANRHLQVWDARSNPANPQRTVNLPRSLMPVVWVPTSHPFFVFNDVDAPPGDSDVLAVAAGHGIGFAAFDTSLKASPRLLYQDHGPNRWGRAVYAGQAGGRQVAYVAADLSGGLFAYDLTAARSLLVPCIETQEAPVSLCPDVFLGRLGDRSSVRYVDGAGDFVVFSSGTAPGGLEIWSLAQPQSPLRLVEALTADSVYGVALWEDEAGLYLAATLSTELRIYDVSCLRSGPCGLGAPLWSAPKPFAAEALTFSESNGVPFLYLAGGTSECLEGDQNEWLYDVRIPSAPRDISPRQRVSLSGELVSYWGWYYRRNGVHGFNHVTPKVAKFSGMDLFRAAKGILDVHRRTEPAGEIPFFADGFESGGFGAWDSVVP